MSFGNVGSFIQFTASTFSLTPGGAGDLILLEIENPDTSVWCTGVSSSNATWSQMGTRFTGSTNARSAVIFAGTVTSTSAQTVTLTFNGTPTNIRGFGQEFSSTAGAWALDVQGNLDSAGTNTWPSLTPAGSGELYFGAAIDNGSAAAGSTTGYTYNTTPQGNAEAHNPACSASAQAPVWGDSGQAFGVMILVKETSAAPPAAPPAAPLTPPGRSSPMAFQWQAVPSQAPVLVPVADSDSGSGADAGSVTALGNPPSAVLTPPGRLSPMAWQFRAWPSQAPVLTPVSDSDSGTGADSGSAVPGTPPPVQPLVPPGRSSPMAWQWQAGPSGAPVLVPVSDSDSGAGSDSAYAGPPVQSYPLTPPGRSSPMAWQWQAQPSQAPVLVPVSGGDSGTGSDSGLAAAVGQPSWPLTPPGLASPMAFQRQAWPTGAPVLVPVSDGDSGAGADSASAGPPVQSWTLTPPGRQSPAAWQWQAGPSGAPLLVPVSDGDAGTGTDSGSAAVIGTPPTAPLIPPAPFTPMGFQWRALPSGAPLLVPAAGADTGAGADTAAAVLRAAAAAAPAADEKISKGAGATPAPAGTGSWWGLDSILKQSRSEFEYFVSRPPTACPNCGEPLSYAPATKAGSGVERYCKFDGFQYPRDHTTPSRPMP